MCGAWVTRELYLTVGQADERRAQIQMQTEGKGVDEVRGRGVVEHSGSYSGSDTQATHQRPTDRSRVQSEGTPLTQLHSPWQLLACNNHNTAGLSLIIISNILSKDKFSQHNTQFCILDKVPLTLIPSP